jgi:hypothetical protein
LSATDRHRLKFDRALRRVSPALHDGRYMGIRDSHAGGWIKQGDQEVMDVAAMWQSVVHAAASVLRRVPKDESGRYNRKVDNEAIDLLGRFGVRSHDATRHRGDCDSGKCAEQCPAPNAFQRCNGGYAGRDVPTAHQP